MPNLIKKSWTVSNGGLLKCIMDETQAKHVTMIDLDEIVMEACALHMKSVCGNYLDKSQRKGDRYHVITGDALYFMEEHSTMVPVCNYLNINPHTLKSLIMVKHVFLFWDFFLPTWDPRFT